MGVFDLFSKRQKRLRGKVIDVYYYDRMPAELRVQVIPIIKDAIGVDRAFTHQYLTSQGYEFLHKTLCREYEILAPGQERTDEERLFNYFLKINDVEKYNP